MAERSPGTADIRLRTAVDSAPSGLLLTDATGSIILVNREIERLFGYSREELLGQPVEMLVPERFRGKHTGFREGFIGRPQARPMGAGRDLYGLRKDGTEVPVEIGLTPVVTDEGMAVISTIVDISARKRAEAEQRRLEEALRHAQKMEAIGTLAGGIAHDFNNILGAIVGYAELAQQEVGDRPGPARDLTQLLETAARGKELVQQILAFSRRQETTRRTMTLDTAVGEVHRLLKATAPPNIDLKLRVTPALPRVAANPTSVHQVVMNLATNAIQAMPEGGVLEIAVEPLFVTDHVARAHPGLPEGPYAVVSVRDSGVGMDDAVRTRAFEPFFTTKAPGVGTGLGLSIVHSVMRDHGGAVEVESAPGVGTTFRCFFPALAWEPAVEADRSPSPEPGAGEPILYVDDQDALAEVGVRRLVSLGYGAHKETDATRALEEFRRAPERFALVITDYSMPRMNGLMLAREIARLRPGTKIVLLTGFIEDLPEEELRAAGIRKVLRKPVSIAELGKVVREVLDGP
jgi:PAS domain S-box-containing protein